MIFKTLLALKNGKGSRSREKGIRLPEHLSVEFNEKQGAFLFNGQTGRAWTLNPSGAMILRGFLNGDAAQTIVENLRARFQVSTSKAFSDITDFRSTLEREGHLENHE